MSAAVSVRLCETVGLVWGCLMRIDYSLFITYILMNFVQYAKSKQDMCITLYAEQLTSKVLRYGTY